jgi:hypothetical protein
MWNYIIIQLCDNAEDLKYTCSYSCDDITYHMLKLWLDG